MLKGLHVVDFQAARLAAAPAAPAVTVQDLQPDNRPAPLVERLKMFASWPPLRHSLTARKC